MEGPKGFRKTSVVHMADAIEEFYSRKEGET